MTLQAYVAGGWRTLDIEGYGHALAPVSVVDTTMVVLTVNGTTLQPVVELSSAADVTWTDLTHGTQLGTGTTPTLNITGVTRVGMRVTDTGAPAWDRVLTLNLGFDSTDDAGRYNLGSGYNRAAQPVTGITGLPLLTGLRRFLAARGTLTGHVDFTGLANLEYIECFQADITSVDLTGCTSLIRLCLEQCRLSSLDLNPVRACLYDCRAAYQQSSSSLTFATLAGPMANLYHYCVRDQPVINTIPHSQLPVVEQYWVWNTGQTACDAPTSNVINSILAYENTYDQPSVDGIYTALVANTTGGGLCVLTGSASPSSTGETARTTLAGRGWSFTL